MSAQNISIFEILRNIQKYIYYFVDRSSISPQNKASDIYMTTRKAVLEIKRAS